MEYESIGNSDKKKKNWFYTITTNATDTIDVTKGSFIVMEKKEIFFRKRIRWDKEKRRTTIAIRC